MADLAKIGASKSAMVFKIGIIKLINNYSKMKQSLHVTSIFFTYIWLTVLVYFETTGMILAINVKINY